MSRPARAPGEPTLPDFVIIGAPKCGTTTLAGWLRQRPDVFVPERKEAEYFNRFHERGLDWYAQKFADAQPHQHIGEATPAYLFDDLALERLATTLPEAPAIAVLREPAARVWSHYWFFRALGVEGRSLRSAIRAEDRAGNAGTTVPVRHYLEHSRYVAHLQAAARALGRDRLLVLFLEEVQADPAAALTTVYDHLGLDPDVAVDTTRTRNPGHIPRSYALQRALIVSRMHRWAPRVARPVTRWNQSQVGREAMTDDWRRELRGRFEQDNAALADWLGRDLPAAWGARG